MAAERPQSVAGTETVEVLQALAATPQEIARLVHGADDQQVHRRPTEDTWSVQEIVAHLRACAYLWGRSISRMLAEDHPTIRYVSPRGWIRNTDYLEQDFADLLRAFEAERTALLNSLRAFGPQGWSRAATFTGTTLGRHATVLQYATRIADHERRHLDQIRRTIETAL